MATAAARWECTSPAGAGIISWSTCSAPSRRPGTGSRRPNDSWSDMGKFLTFLLLSCLAGSPAYATEPLHDLVPMHGKTGFLFPAKCCVVQLPSSHTLDAAKLEGRRRKPMGDSRG